MNEPVTILDPAAGLAKLDRFMARLQSELHKSAEETVKWAAWYVARSLGASTKRAPKRLKLEANPGDSPEHAEALFPFFVTRYRRGLPFRSWVRSDGNKERATRNPRAGLAAQSWLWAIADVGRPVGGAAGLRRPAGAVAGTYAGGMNPSVTIANRLRYIVAAVRQGGRRGVETAVDRGAAAGIHYLDRKVQKAAAS